MTNLEQSIKNALPDLMELSSGCEIMYNNEKWKIVSAFDEQNQTNRLRYIISIVDTSFGYSSKTFVEGSFFHRQIITIGHPILLNDVLEWMGIIKFDYIISNSFLYLFYRDFEDGRNGIKIDFSKPALKDQSQELIDALCELIPKAK